MDGAVLIVGFGYFLMLSQSRRRAKIRKDQYDKTIQRLLDTKPIDIDAIQLHLHERNRLEQWCQSWNPLYEELNDVPKPVYSLRT